VLRPALALIVAMVASSWASILIRLCAAPSLGIAFYRLAFASLILLPFGIGGMRRAGRRTLGTAALAGVVLALHFASWISSLQYTSVASSVMLVSTGPVFAALLGPRLLGERPGASGLIGVALSLLGIAILTGGDLRLGGDALYGDLLALGGALAVAVYFMLGRRVRGRIALPAYLLTVNTSAALTLGLMALATGTTLHSYPRATWLLLLLMAVGPHLIGHGLLNWSVRRLRSFAVTLATVGEPILATIYAALLFRELPGPAFYGGAVLIVLGIGLAMREERADGSL
jgi:drug/metabolite transporter (DMT)-like permease